VAGDRYDVVIIGGAVVGSACAYWLSESRDFDGTVAVIETDPTFAWSSTGLSAASIRHQFSQPVNILLSQFATEVIGAFEELVEVDGEAPELGFRETGYLFLATEAGMATLQRKHDVQRAHGAQVSMITADELHRRLPCMTVDDLAGASLGERHEGTLDAHALMAGFRRRARHNGVTYLTDEVIGLKNSDGRVTSVRLASGTDLGCGFVVNCAGTHASAVADMVGLALPVEPHVRSVFVIDCPRPLDLGPDRRWLPLTVDVTGVWVRSEPPYYMAGGVPRPDNPVLHDDFAVRRDEFDEQIWPSLAHRIPAFDRARVTHSWAGHYAYNTLDQNAVVGPAPELANFVFANGFSGHGLQHAPGIGRGVAELICHGEYRTIDLTPLGYHRIVAGQPFVEEIVI
jgi:glycine/D-amino acid oxidase-like deaminating enzyme